MHCEPATSIIELLGGAKAVAEIAGVDISRVTRWRLPKARGGTGGSIPQRHIPRLLEHAQKSVIPLTADDFFLVDASPPFVAPSVIPSLTTLGMSEGAKISSAASLIV